MKKALRLISAFTFAISAFNAKAQLPTGSIGADFTFTDINSTTQNLYAMLDSGKTVFIDISAAWCSPCWDYHNQHSLDSLYEMYGPAGTDELRVLFIEGELTNTSAQLNGTSSGQTVATFSQGDWVTGTPYPIIDLSTSTTGASTFLTNYGLNYFPTVYMICPDRSVTEVGTADLATLYAAKTHCSAASTGADAEMITALEFNVGLATCDSVTPTFRIANVGTDTLTSATILLQVDGSTQKTINWTGSLATYASTTVTGYKVGSSVAGIHNISAIITNPNGTTDLNAANDSTETSFVFYAAVGGSLVSETFENSGIPNDWIVIPGGSGYTWAYDNAAGYNSSVSAVLPFYYITSGQVDIMKLPPMNFSGYTAAYMTFDVAYAQYSSSTNDRLQVEVSTNCGATWVSKYNKAGASLKTVAATTDSFEPSSDSEWRNEAIDLSSLVGEQQVLVRFKGTSAYGNNLFIDNVNFSDIAPAGVKENALNNTLSVYPNPAITNVTIEFELAQPTSVSYNLVNALGQTIISSDLGKVNGFQNYSVNTSSLPNGLYFLNIKAGNETVIKKVTVSK